jgi:HEPN domain-containing protein
MKREIRNWLDSARYDLRGAENQFNSGMYIHTIFMCHLALEKVLKAKVEEVTEKGPPKTHDLEYLMKLAELSPDEDMEDTILGLSNVSVVTRYPSDFDRTLADFSQEKVEFILSKVKEVFQWIEKSILP